MAEAVVELHLPSWQSSACSEKIPCLVKISATNDVAESTYLYDRQICCDLCCVSCTAIVFIVKRLKKDKLTSLPEILLCHFKSEVSVYDTSWSSGTIQCGMVCREFSEDQKCTH